MLEITSKFEALNGNKPFTIDDMAQFVDCARAAGARDDTPIQVGGNGDVYRAWVMIPVAPPLSSGYSDEPPF